MSASLFAAGLACFAAGGVADLAIRSKTRIARSLPYLFGLAGSICLFVLGIHATTTAPVVVDLDPLFGIGHTALRVDALAGFFLTLLFAIAIAVSACFVSWAQDDQRPHHMGIASGYLLLLAGVAVVLTAADAFLFLFAWEALTVAFYLLTSVTRSEKRQASAAWATIGIGKVSGAALLLGFLLLAGHTGSFTIADWHSVGPGALHDVAWVLVVVGFGAKLGVVPLQVWIPVGYPAAPGPARAAMAGIAANVGVYGLWRFLGVLGRPPVWLVIAVLLIGGVTALLGIAFAGVQSRLARVIAYSSIENAGLIITAYGVALTGVIARLPELVAMGLLAATLQTVAHAVAKSALFTSLANVEAAAGTDDLDALRGIGRRLRWSGAAFGAGAVTLAGLPPTIGFVSEWFILEALMQEFRLPGLALRLGLAAAGALVALTTGLAALTFLRVLGLAFLGRSAEHDRGRDTGLFGKAGLLALGLGCLGLAAVSPWEVRYIARGLSPLVARSVTLQALKAPWVLEPVFRDFSILSPSWLWVFMPVAFTGVLAGALALSRGRYLRIRRVPAWHSATSGVKGPSEYSAFGFANPLRHVLGNVLGTRRVTQVVISEIEGVPSKKEIHLETLTTVVEPVETYLYRPLRSAALGVARVAKRLQSGRLNAYVAYMLLALLAVLAVTAALR
jgi:hydrogenase-4 component B